MAGQTLHYVTLDRQEKQVALGSIDRALTQQLNREPGFHQPAATVTGASALVQVT